MAADRDEGFPAKLGIVSGLRDDLASDKIKKH